MDYVEFCEKLKDPRKLWEELQPIIERSKPRKPRREKGNYKTSSCDVCGWWLRSGIVKHKFCPECGTEIDWRRN